MASVSTVLDTTSGPPPFLFDLTGRVRNLSLPASANSTLIPLFEAISNSLHAVEARSADQLAKQGEITIEVLRRVEDDAAEVLGFVVKDNGVGLKQVKLLLEAQLAVQGDPFAFKSNPPPVINCANGEVWIADDGTIELRPHRPESYLRHLIDVNYDPDAKCPEYDKALLEIFSKAKKPKAMRRHWNEMFGYLIQPRRNIALIAVLLGPGSNGKTVLVRTIVRLIGQAQVHSQRVEELDKNRFAVGSLLGKLVFIDDDVRAGARLPDGTLKMISEAKEVTGENKYKPPFSFVVRTVPLLLCNNVPSLRLASFIGYSGLLKIPRCDDDAAHHRRSGGDFSHQPPHVAGARPQASALPAFWPP